MAGLGQEAALSAIPADPLNRFFLFAEALRVVDYWTVFQKLLPEDSRLRPYDFGILEFGWNRALELIYQPLTTPGFPLMESTEESRISAMALLYQLGRSVLLNRVADMVACGFLEAKESDDGLQLRTADGAPDQFLDNVEFAKFETLEQQLAEAHESEQVMGWSLFERGDVDTVSTKIGRFLSRNSEIKFAEHLRPDIDALMRPLLRQWDTAFGRMMIYESTEEVAGHFLVEATHLVDSWKTEAAFHPTRKLGDVPVSELLPIVSIVVSMHMMHVRFSLLAAEAIDRLNLPQSLTIWKSRDEIEDEILALTGFDKSTVTKAIDAISFSAKDQCNLTGHTSKFVPLLIDLGNGMMLRPISSLNGNPFMTIRALQGWRNSAALVSMDTHREAWQRNEIYGMFQGTRYQCVDGSIKVRDGAKVLTDIDAAIYDRTTGELALFQLKWQDYATNDVRGLRSKASNLARELDEWAQKVSAWLARVSGAELAKSLRLKLAHGGPISAVHLFGVSWVAARTKGWGSQARHERLAIGNLPQFRRIRTEVGPAPSVFSEMHRALREEMKASLEVTPIPFAVNVAGTKVHFHDLWCSINTSEQSSS